MFMTLNTMYNKHGIMSLLLLLCLMVARPSGIGGYRLLENKARDNTLAVNFDPKFGRKVAPSGPNDGGHSFSSKLKSIISMQKDSADYRLDQDDKLSVFKKQILTEGESATSGPNHLGHTQVLFADTQILTSGTSPGDGHKHINGRRATERNELPSVPTVSSIDTRYGHATVVTGLNKVVTVSFDILPAGSSPGVGHR